MQHCHYHRHRLASWGEEGDHHHRPSWGEEEERNHPCQVEGVMTTSKEEEEVRTWEGEAAWNYLHHLKEGEGVKDYFYK